MPRLLTPGEVKVAFSTNAYSGPMNPTFMKMESSLPGSKIPIAHASRAGVAGSGVGSSPTRGGFLLASRQEAPVVALTKEAAEKVRILNGDHYQYLLDKARGDGGDRGRLKGKEKDAGGMDDGYWPYKPGDFKPVDLKPAKLSSARPELLAALQQGLARVLYEKTAETPAETLEHAQHAAKTPNVYANRGASIREVALPKMLTNIGSIARAPVAAVDKGGKI